VTRKALTILVVLMLPAGSVLADGLISVRSSVDRSSILIGDVIRYTVVVEHDPEVELVTPSLAANLGQFEIRDYSVAEPVERDGVIQARTDYLISTYFTGEFEIPPLEIGYTMPGDSALHTIKSEPIPIQVQSLNPDEAGDIRDIKPPLELERNWRRLTGMVLLILAAAALGILLLIWIRRRRRGESLLPKRRQPPRPAHEIALEAIRSLARDRELRDREIKQYYIRLSEIVRVYIHGRYALYALEMTTSQLLEAMAREGVAHEGGDLLSELLHLCDLVKFAKYSPSDQETESALALAAEYVERTRLVLSQDEAEPSESLAQKPPAAGSEAADSPEVETPEAEAAAARAPAAGPEEAK